MISTTGYRDGIKYFTSLSKAQTWVNLNAQGPATIFHNPHHGASNQTISPITLAPENPEQELWTSQDNELLFTAQELEDYREYRAEAEAEVGSEYFIDTRNACDAMFFARQWVDGKFYRAHGMYPYEAHALYAQRYGRSL